MINYIILIEKVKNNFQNDSIPQSEWITSVLQEKVKYKLRPNYTSRTDNIVFFFYTKWYFNAV